MNKGCPDRKNRVPFKRFFAITFLMLSQSGFALESRATQAAPSSDSKVLLYAFIGIAAVLLIVIVAFAEMLKAAAHVYAERQKEKSASGSDLKNSLSVLLLFISSTSMYAQDSATAQPIEPASMFMGLDVFAIYGMVCFILVELIIVFVLYKSSMKLLAAAKKVKDPVAEPAAVVVKQPTLLEKINASISLDEEAEIMLDHNYDGIRELDNNLPPWWKYGFYLTIVIAVVYMFHFHVSGSGKLQLAEYEEQLAQGKADVEEYRKKASNLVDENNAVLLTDQASIMAGKEIYTTNCVACHGISGEGTVGPNLTDDYWIHKGGIKEIFKTIKYGWPEKGMKSWQQDLGAKQIHEVSSYIVSLKGTNPAGAKEKQGELYTEGASDTTAVTENDTIQNIPINSENNK